jgi:hypothetical protein
LWQFPTKVQLMPTQTTALTGDALKARVAELGPMAESDIAIACGYVSANGKAKLSAFKDALLAAHGLSLKPAKTTGRRGKALSFQVTTGKTGNIVMAGGYSALLGIEHGGTVQITHQGDALILTAAGVPAPAATAEPVAAIGSPVVTYDSVPEPALAVSSI